MNPLTDENITGKVLDHLGLITSVIDEIGLIEKIDMLLPLEAKKGVKITMGQRVSSMILNGLGFMNDRLYPEFPDVLQLVLRQIDNLGLRKI